MKKIFSALLMSAAVLAAAPAMAQTGVVAGAVVGSHFDSASQGGSFSFNGKGNGSSESASGFSTTLGGENGAAAFQSSGVAVASIAVTPFTTTSTSFHSGQAGGWASPNASFNAEQVLTFAQSKGANSFESNVNGGWSQVETNFLGFGIAGALGF